MAKLNKKTQQKTEATESVDFSPLPPGIYAARLMAVDATKSGPEGPYWSWEYQVTADPFKGRKLWVNTSLADNALFKMKETFEALGFTLDSDTDEMCGTPCKLLVTQRVIEKGTRAGEKGNNVDRVMPAGDGDDDGDDEDDGFSDSDLDL